MQFTKFSSLENTYNKKLIDKIVYEGLDSGTWMVTSKIHGANFSFWYNGSDFQVASRTQFVDGTFFGCQGVINMHQQNFIDWYHRNYHNGETVVIYGELFGNGIQKEVNYGEKKFRAFDVMIDGKVLDKVSAQFVVADAGFEFVPVLFIGDFESCLQVNNVYRSLFTPADHEGDNYEEGNVIEPVEIKHFRTGKRVYLKNKTTMFSEKNRGVDFSKEKVYLSENAVKILDQVSEYITENRVRNVLSKMGVLTEKQFGSLLGQTMKDVIEEFEKETEINLKLVIDSEWRLFSKTLTGRVTQVVRPVFLEQLDV